MSPIYYSLALWFAFYMVNHAEVTEKGAKWVFARLWEPASKAMQCAFCFSFWVTLGVGAPIGLVPWVYAFCAPVINIFLNLTFLYLCKDYPRSDAE